MKLDEYAIEGLQLRQLRAEDADDIMTLQAIMLAALPKSSWYYPSPRDMFAGCCECGESFGYYADKQLAGFATLTPWHVRGEKCYAAKIQQPSENTYDFQDVMVHPFFRRRGIHSSFLRLFEAMARNANAIAIYCTIAPDNTPSVASFEKAGYRCVKQQPAYEGLWRGYYRKELR